MPSPATSATEPSCQGRSRRVRSRTVAAGTTKSAVTSSAPIAGSAETTPSAISDEQDRVRDRRADPERPRAARVEARSRASGARGAGSPPSTTALASGREHEVARPDQQQAAEEQRVDARARVEDVAGEDHPERERADEHERGEAVVAAAPAAREPLHPEREHERGRERAERRREAEAVREHEAREGRGPGRVREEREPAQHDPRAEQPRADREQQRPRSGRAGRTRSGRARARGPSR